MVAKSYQIDCAICGQPVSLGRRRFLELSRAGSKPICRRNGCVRYAARQISERQDGDETPGAAREPQVVEIRGVTGMVLVKGAGKRGHQRAPLATGRVRR